MNEFLKSIVQLPLSSNQYVNEVTPKFQIVLHHTAGNSSGVAVRNAWEHDKRGRIATCVIISGKGAKGTTDGEIIQCFSSRKWAYHLGVKTEVFKAHGLPWMNLDQIAIGIEICNWGWLEKGKDGKFRTYVGTIVDSSDVCELETPFKGHKYWHNYTPAQIESVKNLLIYWREIYGIPLKADFDQLFSVNKKALRGENGLFTHNSYRRDKSDIYPHPGLLEMLFSL